MDIGLPLPCLAVFGPLDWTTLIAYFAMMIAIGAWSARGQRGDDSFFLGGRSIPAWAVTLSVLATSLSAATFIGVPELAYKGNWAYLIFNIGAILGAIIVATVFIPPLYRAGTITIYGYLDKRFGPQAALGASIAFLLGRLLASGARFYFAAIGFSLILFSHAGTSNIVIAILVLGLIGTIYTVCGGIKAVIWTDVAQIIVVIGAALLSIYIILSRIDMPLNEITDSLINAPKGNKLAILDTDTDLTKNFTLLGGIMVTFLYVASFGVDQDLIQRCMTTRSAARASWSMLISNLLAVPVITLFLIIGSLLYIFHDVVSPSGAGAMAPALDTKDIYPRFLVNQLPAGLSGLAMAGLFAAAMSSFDSAVNAMAATAIADIHGPWRKRSANQTASNQPTSLHAPRLAVVLMGALLTAFAIAACFMQEAAQQSLIAFALGVMTFAYAGLLGVFLTALLTPRGNSRTAIAALIVGVLVILLCQPYILPHLLSPILGEPFTLAMPYSMALATVVSFITCAVGAPKHTPGRV